MEYEEKHRQEEEQGLSGPSARFETFCGHVFEAGALEEKAKFLIALASASVGRSPQAFEDYRERARRAGARAEEVEEALAVAGVQGGGTQVFWMKADFEEALGERWRQELIPDADRSFWEFKRAVYEHGVLDGKTKQLIAVAVSSMLRCRHCTGAHLQAAQKAGASRQEIAEALAVLWAVGTAAERTWRSEAAERMLWTAP